MHSNCLLKHVS